MCADGVCTGAEEQFFSKGGPNKKKNEILSFFKKITK